MRDVILLEGPDGAGKTTIADACREVGYSVLHNGPPSPIDTRTTLYNTYMGQMGFNGGAGPVIIDRSWPSELAYGKIFRGGSPLEELRFTLSQVPRVKIVVFLPPIQTCLKAIEARGEEVKPLELERLWWWYYGFAVGGNYSIFNWQKSNARSFFVHGMGLTALAGSHRLK